MSSASGGLRLLTPDRSFAPGPHWGLSPPDRLALPRSSQIAPSKVNSCNRDVLDPPNSETVVAPLMMTTNVIYYCDTKSFLTFSYTCSTIIELTYVLWNL